MGRVGSSLRMMERLGSSLLMPATPFNVKFVWVSLPLQHAVADTKALVPCQASTAPVLGRHERPWLRQGSVRPFPFLLAYVVVQWFGTFFCLHACDFCALLHRSILFLGWISHGTAGLSELCASSHCWRHHHRVERGVMHEGTAVSLGSVFFFF